MSAARWGESALTPLDVFRLKEERVARFDMVGQADLFAVDGVMEFPFAPPGTIRRLVGREEIGRVLQEAVVGAQSGGVRLLRHNDYTVHETQDPEVIVVEFEAVGVSAEGTRAYCPYIQVLRIRNGEIVLFRDYWTFESAQRFWGMATAERLRDDA